MNDIEKSLRYNITEAAIDAIRADIAHDEASREESVANVRHDPLVERVGLRVQNAWCNYKANQAWANLHRQVVAFEEWRRTGILPEDQEADGKEGGE